MRLNSLEAFLAVLLAMQLGIDSGFAVAASPAIGTIVTLGAFRMNQATLTSNATLFAGATIETGAAGSLMELASGTRLELGPESRGRFFGDHLVLERGQSKIDKSLGFRVEARGLTVLSDTGGSTGRIRLPGSARVEVSALTGSFRVLNSRGMVVAKIASGKALVLEPQQATGPTRVTGRLVKLGGHYLLTDETTNITVELTAKKNLANQIGQRLEVTGSSDGVATPVSDATELIEVAQATPAPPPATAPAGAGGSSGTGGAAGGAGGGAANGAAVSVTLIAVIAGVAAAAVVGGLAASGSLGGSAAAPVSR